MKTKHGEMDMRSLFLYIKHYKRDIDPHETASKERIPFSHMTKLSRADEIRRCDLAQRGPSGIAELSQWSFLPVENNNKESSIERLHTDLIHSRLLTGNLIPLFLGS